MENVTVSERTEESRLRWLAHYDPNVPPHLTYPRRPLYNLLDESAARRGDAPCATFFGRRFTYQQMQSYSDRCAAGLQSLGIKPGERVGLLLPNSPPFIVAYFGALKAGAVIVPLNPLYTERELTFHLVHAGVETVITIPALLDKAIALRAGTPLKRIVLARLADYMPFPLSLALGAQELRATAGKRDLIELRKMLARPLPAGWHPAEVSPDDMAILTYSGGTTGTAKGIMLSHFNLVANAHQVRAWGELKTTDRLLAVLPFFHGFGMSVTMNGALLAGGEIVMLPRFKARDVAAAIQRYRPTFFIGVPTMFVALSSLPDIARYDLSSLQGIFVGAAPLTQGIKEGFETKTGARMIEGYGLTEAVTAIMANPYHGRHKLGSIGVPFPDVECKIVDLADGHDLGPGETGEIVLKSPSVMLGYYHDPQETAATIVDGWLHTGDIGRMDEDGYFYITDRKKELIIVGGFNVFPREIDELIYAHPKVKEGICVGLPDPVKGERIKVYLVLKDGETATAGEMLSYFRERLAPYKRPAEVEFRADLPKSMIGKIMRRALREEEMRKQL